MENDDFWLNNIFILMKQDRLTELFPNKELTLERKMNAITRVVLILCILGFLATKSVKILVSSIVTLIIIVILYKTQSAKRKLTNNRLVEILESEKEGFTNPELYKIVKSNYTEPTKENPMMNITLNEISDNPERKRAGPSYNKAVEEEINNSVKENLDSRLFKDLGDDLYFEQSMRQFYTTPNTTVPNNQKAFAEFCYGGMLSGKEGDVY